jgi:stearoyl-CoA desaturase (delta-9 desaturase)
MLSNDTKVKIVQASAYLCALYTVVFLWDTKLVLIGLFLGWVLFGLAVSVSLHKYSAHRTYTPKNRFIKWVVLWFGTIGSLGSNICWAAQHREHHKYSDQDKDPHSPHGTFWHKVKVWFYYVPDIKISPMVVKDLTTDKDHIFFHRHYYKIIALYVFVLWLFGFKYVGYFYALPVVYTFTGISWLVVVSHLPSLGRWSWRTYNTSDYSVNSHIGSLLFICEGYHNTHHGCPGLWDNAINKWEFDLTAPIIKIIGVPNKPVVRTHEAIRRGTALRNELKGVIAKQKVA